MKGKRKVLFLATVYSHLAAFHLPFMRLLEEKGYEVHAAGSFDGREGDVAGEGFKCWDIPFARSPYSQRNFRAWKKLKELFLNNYYDLIHMHTPVAAFLGRYLGRKTKQGKLLYTAHGFHFFGGAPWRNWLVYYSAERIAARWTDGLIVMNEEDLKNARRLGFKDGENLFYVHGVGVELERYFRPGEEDTLRPELGLGPDEVLVSCVGEFNPNKNQTFLLQGWKEVAARCGNAHLLLIGTGELASNLKEKAKQEKIQRVHFLGYRRDVPQILQSIDIAVLTSKREGLPRCIMEAMAAGKAVVASDVRGNRDLVEDEKSGFLVKLGDEKALFQALVKLIEDKALRQKMGAAGREKIKAYSLEQVLGEMERIYMLFLEGENCFECDDGKLP